jgi:hypothetical protein
LIDGSYSIYIQPVPAKDGTRVLRWADENLLELQREEIGEYYGRNRLHVPEAERAMARSAPGLLDQPFLPDSETFLTRVNRRFEVPASLQNEHKRGFPHTNPRIPFIIQHAPLGRHSSFPLFSLLRRARAGHTAHSARHWHA